MGLADILAASAMPGPAQYTTNVGSGTFGPAPLPAQVQANTPPPPPPDPSLLAMSGMDLSQPGSSGIVNPSILAGALSDQAAEKPAPAPAFHLPQAVSQLVKAKETGLISDPREQELERDEAGQVAAQNDLGAAQVKQAQDQGYAAGIKGQALGNESDVLKQRAADRDTELKARIDKFDALSRDVSEQRIDPDNFWKHQNTGQKILYGISAVLGGFMQGIRGGDNPAMTQINRQIDLDLDAQKQAIQMKKGRLGDMQGILAETYKRFGNMDQAMDAARALSLQQVDQQMSAMAAGSNSEAVQAAAQQASSKLKTDIDLHKAQRFSYTAEHTVTSGGVDWNKVNNLAAQIDKDAATNGRPITPEDARNRAMGLLGYVSGVNGPEINKQPKGATENGPPPPMPRSTALGLGLQDVSSRFQGTQGNENLLQQQAYNSKIMSAMHRQGARTPEAQREVGAAYIINPGDSQQTIARKYALGIRDGVFKAQPPPAGRDDEEP